MSKRFNWTGAAAKARVRAHGSEDVGSTPPMYPGARRAPRPSKAQLRADATAAVVATAALKARPAKPQPLAEAIVINRFWRNRRGESVTTRLRAFEGHMLCDLRIFYTARDGTLQPTQKGVSVAVARLPDLLRAIEKAIRKAIDLGLIEEGDINDERHSSN
jgi:hypothetical protein